MLLLARMSILFILCLVVSIARSHTLVDKVVAPLLEHPAALAQLASSLQGEYRIMQVEGSTGFAALSEQSQTLVMHWSGLIAEPVSPTDDLRLADQGYFLMEKRSIDQAFRVLEFESEGHRHQLFWINGKLVEDAAQAKASRWGALLIGFRELGLFAQARAAYLGSLQGGATALLGELESIASPLARKTFVDTLLAEHRLLRADLMAVINTLSELPDSSEKSRLIGQLFGQHLYEDHRLALYEMCVALKRDAAKVSVAVQLIQTAQSKTQLASALACGETVSSDRQRQILIESALRSGVIGKHQGHDALFGLIGQLHTDQAKAKMIILALETTPDNLIIDYSLNLLATFNTAHTQYSVLHSLLTQQLAPPKFKARMQMLIESLSNPAYRRRGLALLQQLDSPQAP